MASKVADAPLVNAVVIFMLADDDPSTTVTSEIKPPLPLLISTTKLDITDGIPVIAVNDTDLLYSGQKFDTATIVDDDPSNAVNNKPIPTVFPERHDRSRKDHIQ